MPNPIWRHVCKDFEVLSPSRECSWCGARGAFDGWHLSRWEAAGVHHYVFGLDPFGPHRDVADELLGPLRDPCVRCGGRAVLTIDEETWSLCPTCEGTGGVWNRPFEEVDLAWREVVRHWPQAAQPRAGTTDPKHEQRTVQESLFEEDTHDAAARPSTDVAVRSVGKAVTKAARRSPRSRRKGHSAHGVRFDDVVRAFAEAERRLGQGWRLKGPGHCRRVSLDARYSRYAVKGAARSWEWVTPQRSGAVRRLMPLALVLEAAKILGVAADILISREF